MIALTANRLALHGNDVQRLHRCNERCDMKTVIDESGRIQLPENVRTQMGVKAGDEILLEERAGEWVLKSTNTGTGLSWEGKVLVHKGKSTVSGRIEGLIDQAREERFRDASGRK